LDAQFGDSHTENLGEAALLGQVGRDLAEFPPGDGVRIDLDAVGEFGLGVAGGFAVLPDVVGGVTCPIVHGVGAPGISSVSASDRQRTAAVGGCPAGDVPMPFLMVVDASRLEARARR
jgi:hypothetical protein